MQSLAVNAVTIARRMNRISRLAADRVVLTLLAAVALLAIADDGQATRSIRFTLEAAMGMAPFFLLAITMTGIVKASGADAHIARAFQGRTAGAIVLAAVTGAVSPFCSCGVIPLISAMLATGVPLAPVMAFCIASPIMDPEMFVLTAAGIDLGFAVGKTTAAISMGLLAGVSVHFLEKTGVLANPLKQTAGCGCQKPPEPQMPETTVMWAFWKERLRRQRFLAEAGTSGFFLGKWLLLAFFLESLMLAYVSQEWIAGLVGQDNALAIPGAALVGVPAYLNGYAAIPLLASLMEMGMTPGAAMAFGAAGAVSSIPAAMAVYALVRKPVFLCYIGLGMLGAVLSGYGYEWVMGML